jgi:hypothetical protein
MKTTIDMAREVDPVTKLLLDKKLPQGMDHAAFMWFLERFAELVRADQCEIDAKIADGLTKHSFLGSVGDAIRARGNS